MDNEGNILPRNTEGVIGVRVTPTRPMGLFSHYVDDEKRNKATFKGEFYLTGDRGKMDEDDYIWFIGRDDDVMLSSGYRIGPFEVESALIEHPAVLESAVVSSPDQVRGETFLCGTYPCLEVRPGSMGKAAPGVELEVTSLCIQK